MLTALIGVACAGSAGEIPIQVMGVDEALAGSLRTELVRWVSKRDLTPCDGENGLVIDGGSDGVTVSFERAGRRQTRAVPADVEPELFAFTVAAAAEELVRSLSEAFPDRPVFLLGRAMASSVAFGTASVGGGLGVGFRPSHRVQLELTLGASGLVSRRLPSELLVSGARVELAGSATWFVVRLGAFELGPRAEVRAGATFLSVSDGEGVLIQGASPSVQLMGGAELGFNAGWWWVALHGGAGAVVVGTAVREAGVSLVTTRGFTAGGGVSFGVRW